jgi:hypothetical protein
MTTTDEQLYDAERAGAPVTHCRDKLRFDRERRIMAQAKKWRGRQ